MIKGIMNNKGMANDEGVVGHRRQHIGGEKVS
jgi:hypothetical protein